MLNGAMHWVQVHFAVNMEENLGVINKVFFFFFFDTDCLLNTGSTKFLCQSNIILYNITN